MNISTSTIRFRLLTGLLASCLVAPAVAQQSDQNSNRRSAKSQQQDRQQRGTRIRVQPEGWIRMAVDYDNDGRFDAVETVYAYDLQVAQQRSKQRQQQKSGASDSGRSSQQRARSSQQRSQQTHQVQGKISDLRKISMHDGDGRYVVARVRTQNGRTAKVLLGREDQLSKLKLREDDQVQIRGRNGRINDQPVLVAIEVSSGDQRVRVQPKRMNRPLRQVQGEVLRTRTAQFRGHDEPFVVAEMRTREGQQTLVNLGPKSKLGNVNFSEADQVRLLAAPGKVNGQNALIAEQINVDGRTIKIKPNDRRERQWSGQQGSRSQSDRRQRGR